MAALAVTAPTARSASTSRACVLWQRRRWLLPGAVTCLGFLVLGQAPWGFLNPEVPGPRGVGKAADVAEPAVDRARSTAAGSGGGPSNVPAQVRGAGGKGNAALGLASAAATAAGRLATAGGQGRRAGQEDPQKGGGSADFLPRALLFLFALFCSTNFTTLKVLEADHAEQAVAAVRFIVATLPFLAMLPRHMDWGSIRSGVEIGLWCSLGYLSQAMGLPYTDASKGAFICSLAMVVVPVVKALGGATVRPQLWGAVLLAVAGTGLLVGVGGTAGPNVGDMICGGTALGFGLMFVRMDHYAKEKDFSPMGCTIWQVVTLAVTMTAWLLWSSGPQGAADQVAALLTSSPSVLAILAWVGIVTTAGVLYVETWAMEKVDGTEAGIIFASEPVWASLFASVVLGESFGATEAAGGALILLACLLTQVKLEAAGGAAEEREGKGVPA